MLTSIETQLATDIETTSVASCAFGFPGNMGRYPAASCAWRSGRLQIVSGAGHVRDLALTLQVQIEATDAATAQTAAEEVSALWYDVARFATLSALGVVSILPAELQPPLGLAATAQVARALVEFDVVVRFA